MFYKVGEAYDRSYIYDDTDRSCELVKNSAIKSGVDYIVLNTKLLDMYKVVMLYGFKSCDDGVYMTDLMTYEFKAVSGNTKLVTLRFELKIILVKTDAVIWKERYNNDDYAIIISIDSLDAGKLYRAVDKLDTDKVVRNYSFVTGSFLRISFKGIQIPLQMLDYILYLSRNWKSDDFFRAFDGVLSEDIHFTYDSLLHYFGDLNVISVNRG